MEDEELATQKTQAVFEFTKRKRWPDILISELVNVAVLVFSTSGAVIHCDAATHAVTGYSEDQMIGKNFADFLHEGDTLAFFKALEDSIATKQQLTFYLRIRASDPRDRTTRLIELKANPFFGGKDSTECLCVFCILSPYPSPAVSDLDDFLALRIENERLAMQLEALRSGNYSDETLGTDSEVEEDRHRPLMEEENIVDRSERAIAQASAALDTMAANAVNGKSTTNPSFTSPTNEANPDGQPLKKKRRLTESSQGRVCTACGRNNSPEWRKGPQGPKTLCNACGLRWAKKAKGTTRDTGMDD